MANVRVGGPNCVCSVSEARRTEARTPRSQEILTFPDPTRCETMQLYTTLTTLGIWCLRPFIPRSDDQSWDNVPEYSLIHLLDSDAADGKFSARRGRKAPEKVGKEGK